MPWPLPWGRVESYNYTLHTCMHDDIKHAAGCTVSEMSVPNMQLTFECLCLSKPPFSISFPLPLLFYLASHIQRVRRLAESFALTPFHLAGPEDSSSTVKNNGFS